MSQQALYEQAPGSHKWGDLLAAEQLYLAARHSGFPAHRMLGARQGEAPGAFTQMESQVPR